MKKEKNIDTPVQSQREKSKAKRRAAIIDVAKRSFLENGYNNTTMSAISQQMGGSKGTLWSYFTTKEELFAAVVDSLAAAFQSFMGVALDTNKDMHTALTSFCETFIERISRPEAIAIQRMIVSQAERVPEVAHIFYDHGPAINHATVASFLKKQMSAGVIPHDNPDEAAKMLLDLCTAGYHDRVFYSIEAQNERIEQREAARIVKQFLRCYGPVKSAKRNSRSIEAKISR